MGDLVAVSLLHKIEFPSGDISRATRTWRSLPALGRAHAAGTHADS